MSDKAKTMEEAYNKDGARRAGWAAFVESHVVSFFKEHELEKLSVEDGNGNKAKLTLTRDEDIKVEYSSIAII
jgi:hypothetical protein